MTTKRNPEERSGRGAARSAAASAKPTGDEVYETTTAAGAGATVERETGAAPEEARSQLQQLATGYYENLSQTAAQLSRQTAEVLDVGNDVLRRNPWAAIGTAAGVGLLIGILID